jgi:hypothetical protein
MRECIGFGSRFIAGFRQPCAKKGRIKDCPSRRVRCETISSPRKRARGLTIHREDRTE